jgi:hypothetical protein
VTAHNPTDTLHELEAAARAAATAEREAREEHERKLRAVHEARNRLTGAYATGDGVPLAEKVLQAAQKAAADPSLPARIEGLAQARRRAESDVGRFSEQHVAELVEALRPRAEHAVADVLTAAAALDAALDEWNRCAAQVGRVGGRVQWFRERIARTVPSSDRFGALRRELERLRMVDLPLPMPAGPVESPAQEQQRLRREHEAQLAGGRI